MNRHWIKDNKDDVIIILDKSSDEDEPDASSSNWQTTTNDGSTLKTIEKTDTESTNTPLAETSETSAENITPGADRQVRYDEGNDNVSQDGADTVSLQATECTSTSAAPETVPTSIRLPSIQHPKKRKATPENWKKNKRKTLKIAGQEYINQEGKAVRAKSVQVADCSNCRFKCFSKISEEARQRIFAAFWNLKSFERQKDFICSHTEQRKTRTYLDEDDQVVERKRQVYRGFFLKHKGKRHNVCKTFFRKTLDVGESYINHALQHEVEGTFAGADNRGKHPPHNKTSDEQVNRVREHINSFPRGRFYVSRMYELYKGKCDSQEVQPVSFPIYRNIYNDE